MKVKHVIPGKNHPVQWYMKKNNFRGWTSYWGTIYYRDEECMNSTTKLHELKHIEQMRRDGRLVFTIRYIYQWITKGYYKVDYEVEARAAEVQGGT